MTEITLTGRTRKGKNRVREHGPAWVVVSRSASAQCLGGEAGLLIESVTTGEESRRWVRQSADPDFEIGETKEPAYPVTCMDCGATTGTSDTEGSTGLCDWCLSVRDPEENECPGGPCS